MIKLIKLDIKNCLRSTKFQVSLLIMMGICLFSFFSICKMVYNCNTIMLEPTYNMSLLLNGSDIRSTFHLFITILPILAGIMYSDSFIYERNENISNYFFARNKKIQYFMSKVVVIFLVVFMSIFLSFMLNEILTWIAIPNIGRRVMSAPYEARKLDEYIFLPAVKYSTPYLYNIMLISIMSLYGAFTAVLAFNISLLVKVKSIALFIITFLISSIIPFIISDKFDIVMYLQGAKNSFGDFIITLLGWIFLIVITFTIGVLKECRQ